MDNVLTQSKLEQFLNVTTMTVHLWRKLEPPLPFRKVYTAGGKPRVLYPTQEVLDWLKDNRPRIYGKIGGQNGQSVSGDGSVGARAVYPDAERIAS